MSIKVSRSVCCECLESLTKCLNWRDSNCTRRSQRLRASPPPLQVLALAASGGERHPAQAPVLLLAVNCVVGCAYGGPFSPPAEVRAARAARVAWSESLRLCVWLQVQQSSRNAVNPVQNAWSTDQVALNRNQNAPKRRGVRSAQGGTSLVAEALQLQLLMRWSGA